MQKPKLSALGRRVGPLNASEGGHPRDLGPLESFVASRKGCATVVHSCAIALTLTLWEGGGLLESYTRPWTPVRIICSRALGQALVRIYANRTFILWDFFHRIWPCIIFFVYFDVFAGLSLFLQIFFFFAGEILVLADFFCTWDPFSCMHLLSVKHILLPRKIRRCTNVFVTNKVRQLDRFSPTFSPVYHFQQIPTRRWINLLTIDHFPSEQNENDQISIGNVFVWFPPPPLARKISPCHQGAWTQRGDDRRAMSGAAEHARSVLRGIPHRGWPIFDNKMWSSPIFFFHKTMLCNEFSRNDWFILETIGRFQSDTNLAYLQTGNKIHNIF